MAAKSAEGSVTREPAKLADDFATWWSGVPWTWKLKKVEKVKSIAETISSGGRCSEMLERMKARLKSPRSPSKPASEPSMSETPVSPPTAAPPAEEGLPLHIVSPYFEVKRSAKGGYGAFAIQDITAYTDILFEHALLQATSFDILEHFDNLSADDKERFLRLASFDELDSNKVIAIFKTNRFQVCGGICGIFPIASRFNHACFPLCAYRYNTEIEQLILTTKADISKNQEITISYGQTGDELFYSWGFICDCGKCFPTGKVTRW